MGTSEGVERGMVGGRDRGPRRGGDNGVKSEERRRRPSQVVNMKGGGGQIISIKWVLKLNSE